jgi:Fe2+ transport system protein FeoA
MTRPASHLLASADVVERARRDAPGRATTRLVNAEAGRAWRVAAIDPTVAAELGREGILPGTDLTVVTRLPLGGPLVVSVGRSRLAVSADLATRIEMEPVVDRTLAVDPAPRIPS